MGRRKPTPGAPSSPPVGRGGLSPLRLLVLGGTVFLGRHVVDAALARGHTVTLLHRGLTAPGLFPSCEHVRGDREAGALGLAGLAGRTFDAVIDTSGKVPRVVGASVAALRGRIGLYAFVSSASVYPLDALDKSEGAAVQSLPAPDTEAPEHYGALKAACEAIVCEAFAEAAHIARPGLIGGPYDPTGRFTYWALRMAAPGPVLAPGAPGRIVQVIDARDVANWLVSAAERALGGTYNVSGPARPTPLAEVLAACGPATPRWASDAFLEAAGVEPYSEMPLWIPAGHGSMVLSLDRALAAGLTLRPLTETALDTRAWARVHRAAHPDWREVRPGGRGDDTLTAERERDLLLRLSDNSTSQPV